MHNIHILFYCETCSTYKWRLSLVRLGLSLAYVSRIIGPQIYAKEGAIICAIIGLMSSFIQTNP